jgi:hypothetical protein
MFSAQKVFDRENAVEQHAIFAVEYDLSSREWRHIGRKAGASMQGGKGHQEPFR